MKRVEKLSSLKQTLNGISEQIKDSVPFAKLYIGNIRQAPQLFTLLKNNTTYKNDPNGEELLQSMQTLLSEANYHGRPGYGDCDCFTIAAVASCIAAGIPVKIVLAGNSQDYSHIYALTKYNGNWWPFDLTEPAFGSERKYKFTKEIPVKIF